MSAKTVLPFLLLAVILKQFVWSAFIPLWHTPDEQAHFAQVENFAQTGKPKKPRVNLPKEIWLSEKLLGTERDSNGNNKFTYHPQYNITYSTSVIGPNELQISQFPSVFRREYIKSEATGYPPLYYFLASLVYKSVQNGSLFDRVFLVRIFTTFTLLGIVIYSYKISKLVFSDDNFSVFILPVLVGFMPMLSFVHSGVSSDSLFNLLFIVIIYYCLKLINTGITLRLLIPLVVLTILSFLCKPQANIIFFLLTPLLIFLFFRDRLYQRLNKKIIGSAVIAVLIILYSLSGIIERVYLGKSIIPESAGLGTMTNLVQIKEHIIFTLNHTYSEVLPWYWGVFRWLSLGLPDILRKITNWLTIFSFAGFFLYFAQNLIKKKFDRKFQMVAFCAFSMLVYFFAITVFDFGFRQSHGFSFGIQGRYFFPILVPQMLISLIGLTFFFSPLWQKRIGLTLAIGMIILHTVVFIWVVGSYYSLSFPQFFIQASQYKPSWLKFPINLLILTSSITALIAYITIILRPPEVK